jgi:hypothetical protein
VYRINEPIPARCGAVEANPSRIVNENHEEISKSMKRPKAKPPMIEMVQRLLMELQELGWGQDETMTEVLDRCTPPKPKVKSDANRCPICGDTVIKDWESAVAVLLTTTGWKIGLQVRS